MEFVSDLNHHDPVEFLQVRRVLECEAASLAAARIDSLGLQAAQAWLDKARAVAENSRGADHEGILECDRGFHEVIADSSGNQALAALLAVFAGRTWRLRTLRSETDSQAVEVAVREHQAILDALRAGDSERARVLMHVHLLGVEDFARRHSTPADTRP